MTSRDTLLIILLTVSDDRHLFETGTVQLIVRNRILLYPLITINRKVFAVDIN